MTVQHPHSSKRTTLTVLTKRIRLTPGQRDELRRQATLLCISMQEAYRLLRAGSLSV